MDLNNNRQTVINSDKNELNSVEKIVEHLPDLLINTEDITQKQALFRLVFEEPPTYDEIISGTPNLTEIF